MVIVGDKLIKLAGNYALKLIAKKFKLDKVLEYVEKPNTLDKMVGVIKKSIDTVKKSIDRLFNISQSLEARITDIEKYYHNRPPQCKCEVKEKEGKWYDK